MNRVLFISYTYKVYLFIIISIIFFSASGIGLEDPICLISNELKAIASRFIYISLFKRYEST